MSALEIRLATLGDVAALRSLLTGVGLPVDDFAGAGQEFVVALEAGRLVGCVGVEMAGEDCLLRSLAVVEDRRGEGIASALHERALALAAVRSARTAYLLTTTAEEFARHKGFERVDRALVPPPIAALPQFRGICCASAVCMRRRIAGAARL